MSRILQNTLRRQIITDLKNMRIYDAEKRIQEYVLKFDSLDEDMCFFPLGRMPGGFAEASSIIAQKVYQYNKYIFADKITEILDKGFEHLKKGNGVYKAHSLWITHPDKPREPYFNSVHHMKYSALLMKQYDKNWEHYFWVSDLRLFPQTIKSLEGYPVIVKEIKEMPIFHGPDGEKYWSLYNRSLEVAPIIAGDLMKYYALYSIGGVAIDVDYKVNDAEMFASIPKFFNFAASYFADVLATNTFIYADQYHPIIKYVLELAENNMLKLTPPEIQFGCDLNSKIGAIIGPMLVGAAFFHKGGDYGSIDVLFPPHLFLNPYEPAGFYNKLVSIKISDINLVFDHSIGYDPLVGSWLFERDSLSVDEMIEQLGELKEQAAILNHAVADLYKSGTFYDLYKVKPLAFEETKNIIYNSLYESKKIYLNEEFFVPYKNSFVAAEKSETFVFAPNINFQDWYAQGLKGNINGKFVIYTNNNSNNYDVQNINKQLFDLHDYQEINYNSYNITDDQAYLCQLDSTNLHKTFMHIKYNNFLGNTDYLRYFYSCANYTISSLFNTTQYFDNIIQMKGVVTCSKGDYNDFIYIKTQVTSANSIVEILASAKDKTNSVLDISIAIASGGDGTEVHGQHICDNNFLLYLVDWPHAECYYYNF
jgi:hypothetical protein